MNALSDLSKKIGKCLFILTATIEYWHKIFYKNLFLTALLFNIAMLAFTAIFGYIRYETCDDYLPAFFVSGAFGEYTHQLIYMNTLYTRFLTFLSSTFKEFPWYATVLYSLTFVGMTHFTWLLLSFNPKRKLLLSYIIAVVVLWFGLDIYTAMQYTKVAMILSGPALWGVFTLFFSGESLRKHKCYFMFCAILFQLGGLIRFQSLLFLIIMAPVICAVMFLAEIWKTGSWKTGSWKTIIRPYIQSGVCFICFFFVAGSLFGYHKHVYNSTELGRFILERDHHSHLLMNYGSIAYNKYEKVYKEIGFSKADVALLEHWYFGSPEYYTGEKLDHIVAASSSMTLLKTNPKKFFLNRLDFFKCCFEHVRRAAVLLLLLFGAIFLKNKKAAFWGGAFAYFAALLVLAYRGRIVDRIACCMLLFALTGMIYGLQRASVYPWWNFHSAGKLCYARLMAFAAGLVIFAGPTLSCLKYFYINGEQYYLRKTQNGAQEAMEYIRTHKDDIFAATTVFTSEFRGAQPFRKFVFGEYSNVVPAQGCLMFCSMAQFTRNHVSPADFPKQLVDKDNFYLISSEDKSTLLYQADVFLDFIREHYYPDVKVKKIREFDSGKFGLYKYYIERSDEDSGNA